MNEPRAILSACVAGAVLLACNSGGVSPSTVPSITAVQPLAGSVGTRVTIVGTGFDSNANTVNFGASAYANVAASSSTSILFPVPTATNPPCRNVTPPCAIASALITPGTYDLSVTNSQGTSDSVRFTVTGS